MHDQTDSGAGFKVFIMVHERTRECLALRAARSLGSKDVGLAPVCWSSMHYPLVSSFEFWFFRILCIEQWGLDSYRVLWQRPQKFIQRANCCGSRW